MSSEVAGRVQVGTVAAEGRGGSDGTKRASTVASQSTRKGRAPGPLAIGDLRSQVMLPA